MAIGKWNLVLILGCDLEKNGNALGPRSIARLAGAVNACQGRDDVVFCTTATFSPQYKKQLQPMSTLMARWLRYHTKSVVLDITGPGDFNTRGELKKFMAYTKSISDEKLTIVTAWWHISRVEKIFTQMFGPETAAEVTFIGTAEDFPLKLRVFEAVKWIHALLPPRLRAIIEKVVRTTPLNPSW